jgi:hypothetical protein
MAHKWLKWFSQPERGKANRYVFEMRYQETIDPDKDHWELCSRVLSRRDVVDKLSVPW